MASLSSRFRNDVVPRILTKFGEVGQLVVPGEPDSGATPFNQEATAGDPDDIDVKLAPMTLKEARRTGTLIEATDWEGIMQANIADVPEKDMSLKIDGLTYSIIYIKKLRTQGVNVAYEIAARKP